MGALTFQLVGDASVGTKTKTYTVSNADVNRFVAWAIAKYAIAPTPKIPNPPALTPAQAVAAWADATVNDLKMGVVNMEKVTALKAVANPPPFAIT